MTAGGNLAWAASTGYPGSVSMKQIDSLVKLESAGCGGLLYLPYLNGERCPFEDGNARACFIGISASTTREQMLRAVSKHLLLPSYGGIFLLNHIYSFGQDQVEIQTLCYGKCMQTGHGRCGFCLEI
jgi:sugar (pentulose or hexulose) kinase